MKKKDELEHNLPLGGFHCEQSRCYLSTVRITAFIIISINNYSNLTTFTKAIALIGMQKSICNYQPIPLSIKIYSHLQSSTFIGLTLG